MRLSGKEPTCHCRGHRFDPWFRKILWRRKWQPMTVFLPGKSHGQRSLSGYSPWVCKRVRHDLETKKQQQSTMVGRRRERLLTECHLRGWWDDVAVGNKEINHFYGRDGFVCQTYLTFPENRVDNTHIPAYGKWVEVIRPCKLSMWSSPLPCDAPSFTLYWSSAKSSRGVGSLGGGQDHREEGARGGEVIHQTLPWAILWTRWWVHADQ